MGEGVSLSLPRNGFPVGHGFEISDPFARELGLSQVVSLISVSLSRDYDPLCERNSLQGTLSLSRDHENSVRSEILVVSGSSIADLVEYLGRQVPVPFGAVLPAQLWRIPTSCVDLGCRKLYGRRGATFAGTSVSKLQNLGPT